VGAGVESGSSTRAHTATASAMLAQAASQSCRTKALARSLARSWF
jgi:hypothetical protein